VLSFAQFDKLTAGCSRGSPRAANERLNVASELSGNSSASICVNLRRKRSRPDPEPSGAILAFIR
jgi:hypothetical protein